MHGLLKRVIVLPVHTRHGRCYNAARRQRRTAQRPVVRAHHVVLALRRGGIGERAPVGETYHAVALLCVSAQYLKAEVAVVVRAVHEQGDARRRAACGEVDFFCAAVHGKLIAVFYGIVIRTRVKIPQFEGVIFYRSRRKGGRYGRFKLRGGAVVPLERVRAAPVETDAFKIIRKVGARRQRGEVYVQFGGVCDACAICIAVIIFEPAPKAGVAALYKPPGYSGVGMRGIGVPLGIGHAVLYRCGKKGGKVAAGLFARVAAFIELRPHIVCIFAPCSLRNFHHMPKLVRYAPAEVFGAQAGDLPAAARVYAYVFAEGIRRRARKGLHNPYVHVEILRARIRTFTRIYAAEIKQRMKIFAPPYGCGIGGIPAARVLLCGLRGSDR